MKLETIGANIRKVRRQKKLRQEDLAEKADLTPNYIGAIERGEKIPSVEALVSIMNAYPLCRRKSEASYFCRIF